MHIIKCLDKVLKQNPIFKTVPISLLTLKITTIQPLPGLKPHWDSKLRLSLIGKCLIKLIIFARIFYVVSSCMLTICSSLIGYLVLSINIRWKKNVCKRRGI